MSKKKIKIPLELIEPEDGGCHILVEAKKADGRKGKILLDTGASMTVFDPVELEDSLENIREIETEQCSSGLNAMISGQKAAELKGLNIGDKKLDGITAIVLDLNHINGIYEEHFGFRLWGLLGGDFLKDNNAHVDYAGLYLTLE